MCCQAPYMCCLYGVTGILSSCYMKFPLGILTVPGSASPSMILGLLDSGLLFIWSPSLLQP